MEVLPEIKPMDFRSLTLERLEVAVGDGDVDEEIKRRAQTQRKTEPVDRAAKSGDVAVVDFVGMVDGKQLPGGKADGYYLSLGSGSFIPGFEDQLIGAKPGEARTVNVTFPATYGNKELQGKAARFEVAVKEVREPRDAAIDDELAKALGQENLDGLRSQVRKDLDAAFAMLSRSRLKRKLFDSLTEGHDFPLPAGMVDLEFEGIWQQMQQDRAQGRGDPEDAEKSEDALKADYRRIAERRVRLGLLLAEVGRANKIEVAAAELNRALMNEARRFPGNEARVMDFYSKNPQAAEQLRAPLLEDKVADFILEMATISKREVTAEAFAKADSDDIKASGAEKGEDAEKPKKRKSKSADKD
jgi:trigger factor